MAIHDDAIIDKGVLEFFQTPMSFFSNYELTNALKSYILSKNTKGIESNCTPDLKHNLIESNFNFFDEDELVVQQTAKWIKKCLKEVINTVQSEKVDYSIRFTESWYHITKTNGMHEPHTHLGCSWCGIYYVQSGDEGSGETVFRSPIESTYIDRGNLYLDDRRTIRLIPKDGYLVIFPSYLIHHQALYKGDKDRIVVAFNSTIN